jgi:hypothetical protein
MGLSSVCSMCVRRFVDPRLQREPTTLTQLALFTYCACKLPQISAARGVLAKGFPGLDAMLKPVTIKEDSDIGESPTPVTAKTVTPAVAPKAKAPARKAKAAPVVEVCCCIWCYVHA